jgi:hypothetical protein
MEIPLGNVVTAIATVIAVVVANRLTYSRSTKERLWDLRRQAYGVILTELAAIDRISHAANEYIDGVGGYFESEYFGGDVAKIGEHMKVVRDRFSNDYLILSDDFIRIFDTFLGELSGDPNVAGHDEHLRTRGVITKYRPLLLAQARSEMKIRPRYWPLSHPR